jgi:hypothetical protein
VTSAEHTRASESEPGIPRPSSRAYLLGGTGLTRPRSSAGVHAALHQTYGETGLQQHTPRLPVAVEMIASDSASHTFCFLKLLACRLWLPRCAGGQEQVSGIGNHPRTIKFWAITRCRQAQRTQASQLLVLPVAGHLTHGNTLTLHGVLQAHTR